MEYSEDLGAPKASRWLISCCPIFGLGNNTWMTRHYMIVLFQLNIWPLMRFLHSSEFANLLTPEGHFAFLQVNQPVNKETETHKEQSQRNPDAILAPPKKQATPTRSRGCLGRAAGCSLHQQTNAAYSFGGEFTSAYRSPAMRRATCLP